MMPVLKIFSRSIILVWFPAGCRGGLRHLTHAEK